MEKKTDNALALALYGSDDPDAIFAGKCNPKQLQRRAFSNGGVGKVELTPDECRKLCKACNNLEYLDGYEHRVIQYRVSDETVDRYGDVVRAKGVHLLNYKRNPVIQFAHDYNTPNVGVSVKTWYEKTDNCVYAWALFFDDRLDATGRSDLIYKLAKANAMRACSVGFVPMATRRPDNDERTELGMGDYGVIYEAWDMMEFSPCPVPANPNALRDDVRDEMRANIQRAAQSGLFVARDVSLLKDAPMGLDDVVLDEITREAGPVVITVPLLDKQDGNYIAIDKGESMEPVKLTFDTSSLVEQVTAIRNVVQELKTIADGLRPQRNAPTPPTTAGDDGVQAAEVRKSLYDSFSING